MADRECSRQMRASRRGGRTWIWTRVRDRVRSWRAVAVLLAALLVLAAIGWGQGQASERIPRGVSIAGVAVGGMTEGEARALLGRRAQDWSSTPLTFEAGADGSRWQTTPESLGVRLDLERALGDARGYGRHGNVLHNLFDTVEMLVPSAHRRVAIGATVDDTRLEAALREWAPGATRHPVDARFVVAPDGTLTIADGVAGLGFDLGGSRAALVAGASHLSSGPIALALMPIAPALSAASLAPVTAQAQRLVARPIAITHGNRRWLIPADILGRALGYRLDGSGQLVVALDERALAPLFDAIDADVGKPARDARIVLDGENYRIQVEEAGTRLDREATRAALESALTVGGDEATAVLGPRPARVSVADLLPARDYLAWISGRPLVVSFGGATIQTVERTAIRELLVITPTPGGPTPVSIALDPQRLRRLTQALAEEFNQPVRDAAFVFADRRVRDRVASQEGREIQFAGTDRALEEAILNGRGAATPAVVVTPPRVASADKARINVGDRLAYGETDYSSSIAPRWHNVELAAERLNGALIPPGAIFSFNEQVGAQTIENGYQEAYGIALVGGSGGGEQARTVSSVAGGICQVSTTLFQGVFRAGLPIEERNWHFYWVTYGTPYPGMPGLDATVDEAGGLDFRFANNTGGWLAIEAVADGGTLTIALFGDDPGWAVQIDEPMITNVRAAEPRPIYEKTHDLPVGELRYIEHAADGFDATLRRRVFTADGALVVYVSPGGDRYEMDSTFTSSYLAARDRYQVGVPTTVPEGETEERP